MNQQSPPKRRFAKQTAATAAVVVGAALLIFQGAAPAQAAAAPGDHYDYNGDGYQDLYLVRKSDGHLLFSAGKGDETLPAPVSKGGGWGKMDIVMAGDLTEDDTPDLLARDAKTGTLYTYPGDGSGGFEPRITVGGGWNSMVAFTSAGDFDGDGLLDLYAIRKSDGQLYFYPGKGDGTFGARAMTDLDEELGTGPAVFDSMTTVSGGDGPGLLLHSVVIGDFMELHSWDDDDFGAYASYTPGSLITFGDPTQYLQATAAGDRNEDGYEDFVAINQQSGELQLIAGARYPTQRVRTRLASAGTVYRLPATTYDHTYDFDENYTSDLFTVRSATSTDLTFYPGTGTGTFGSRRNLSFLIDGMTLVETAGDMNGDWIPDLLIRHDDGLLKMMGGDGSGHFLGPQPNIDIGYGWNSMNAIVGGQDFNGDGKVDVVARQKSTGDLYFYPGKGTGALGSRVKIGTGWNSMRDLTAAGDLDHDGHADMLAIKTSDNCLYFYGGRGNGTFKSRIQIGCGWGSYDALSAVGDANRDGHMDVIVRRKTDGTLFLYKGNGTGSVGSRVMIGTSGWNSMKFIA